MYFARKWCCLLVLFTLVSCGNMTDDLIPSGTDKRPPVQTDTIGPAVGQRALDFSVQDTTGNAVTTATAPAGGKGFVLYFTMWCPICDSHMSHMLSAAIPAFPDVRFFAVDYVSGTVADARNSEVANGYAGTAFTVLADVDHVLLQGFQATMGTTVVVDRNGIVRMNEDFRDGSRLQSVLAGLP